MFDTLFRYVAFILSIVFFSPVRYINYQAQPYYNEFIKKVITNCERDKYFLPRQRFIIISNLRIETVAVCHRTNISFMIILDKTYWNSFNDDEKYQVIMHELTHCALRMDHFNIESYYMNPFMQKLSRQEVEKQVDDLINNICKQ